MQTKCLLKLNVSINDKQWPKRPYSTQWYFLFYSNCVLSVCVVRQWALAAPGLCSATRYVVHLSLSDRDRLRKTERQKERRKGGRKGRERDWKNKVPLEPWKETGLRSAKGGWGDTDRLEKKLLRKVKSFRELLMSCATDSSGLCILMGPSFRCALPKLSFEGTVKESSFPAYL